eukprot:SAG31_NODE_31215_length_368_cov_3.025830_1_plen_41_part_10
MGPWGGGAQRLLGAAIGWGLVWQPWRGDGGLPISENNARNG